MKYLSKKHIRPTRGTTLLETLIAVAFFVGVSVAIYGVYQKIASLLATIKVRTVASYIANEQFEIVRNLPYASVGTVGGIPSGVIDPEQTVTRDGITFNVDITVRSIDEAFDGTLGGSPNDTAPADNKLVEVGVSCDNCRLVEPVVFTSTIAPLNLELSSGNGALFVQVFDANGLPVAEAEVTITNSGVSPAINLTDVTNQSGVLQLIDVPPSSEYKVHATKNGYSIEETFSSSELGGSVPVKPYANVAAQSITQTSLSIDKVSELNIESVTTLCSAVPDFDFTLKGTKKNGTLPDIFKYDQTLATSISGILTLSDIEWDTYAITPIDSTYDLIGSSPLLQFDMLPDTVQAIQFIVAPKTPRTLLVTVKDSSTGLPISGASAELELGVFDETKITGQGYLTQSDWSGGAGQTAFIDSTMYFDGDGSLDVATAGIISLREVASDYLASGYLTSSTFDTGSSSTNYSEISWLPSSQPVATGSNSVRFQIATNNDNLTWNFVGPDGTASTYYTSANRTISSVHNGTRYIRYRLFLSTDDTSVTPSISDINITITSSCTPPGQIAFQGLGSGTYTLTVTHPSYNDASSLVDVLSNWQQADVILNP